MKFLMRFFSLTVLLCGLGAAKAGSQTIAMGHISAEVVESVSASSFASTDFVIGNQVLSSAENGIFSADNIQMGTIRINSGQDVACNFNFKPALLFDGNGNEIKLQPYSEVNGNTGNQRVDGAQTLVLKGTAQLGSYPVNGLYKGSYTLVFAYN